VVIIAVRASVETAHEEFAMEDLIVVGDGPAGAVAAKFAAAQGLKVLLFDRKEFPPDKACSGALISESRVLRVLTKEELQALEWYADGSQARIVPPSGKSSDCCLAASGGC
jgi:ribulose 1,5-bisphosphate synthetase/thiazole synthase